MLGGWEWAIILVIALLVFGGSRLAGLGKGVGRSIREFKEEVKTGEDGKPVEPEVVEAEIVDTAAPRSSDARLAELEAREREIAAREEELRRQHETETGR